MQDSNKDRREIIEPGVDLAEGTVEIGSEVVAAEGMIDIVADGVSGVAEVAGDLIGGIFDGISFNF